MIERVCSMCGHEENWHVSRTFYCVLEACECGGFAD